MIDILFITITYYNNYFIKKPDEQLPENQLSSPTINTEILQKLVLVKPFFSCMLWCSYNIAEKILKCNIKNHDKTFILLYNMHKKANSKPRF